MPARYSLVCKNARMEAVRLLLDAGSLVLRTKNENGKIGTKVAEYKLDALCGLCAGGVLLFSGFPKFAMAETKGVIAQAEMRDRFGNLVVENLTVAKYDPMKDARPTADVFLDEVLVSDKYLIRIASAEIRHV